MVKIERIILALSTLAVLAATVTPISGQGTCEDWFNKGNALLDQRKYDEAIQAYDEAIRLAESKFFEAWLAKGRALYRQGKHDEGDAAIDEGIRLDPEGRDAWFWRDVSPFEPEVHPEAVQDLIPEASDSVDEQIQEAMDDGERLGGLDDDEKIRDLILALEDPDNIESRMEAALALGEIGDPRAIDPLIRALKDEDFMVRGVAAQALGMFNDSRVIDPLIDALKDESFSVQTHAAHALIKTGDSRAIDAALKASRPPENETESERLARRTLLE